MSQTEDTSTVELPEYLVPPEARTSLKEVFVPLKRNVELHVYSIEESKDVFSRFVRQIARELGETSDKITVINHSTEDSSKLEDVTALPQIAIQGAGSTAPVLRMVGAPLGEEGRVLVQAIMLAGSDDSGLSRGAKEVLGQIKEKRVIKVFGTGTCPYCPGQMALASAFAKENPEYITAYAIAGDQYPDMSNHYNVGGVPHTVVNEVNAVVGMMPDEPFAKFVKELTKDSLGQYAQAAAKGADSADGYCPDSDAIFGAGNADVAQEIEKAAEHAISADDAEAASYGLIEEKGDEFNPDLLILGGGPAGLTAAVYGARAGLNVTLLDHGMLGGQVSLTPHVENYPGFKSISGTQLVGHMIAQAQHYAHLRGNMNITNLEHKDGRFIAHTSNGLYSARTILFATGASWRKLGVPGEAVLSGRGVHYCATCDGYMYAGKKVCIIGGGNTALTDALHLKNLGIDVTLVHRRDKFRAEQALVNSVHKQGIKVVWNSTVKEVIGKDNVTAIVLADVNSKEETTVATDGVFVSIGQDPNSRPAMAIRANLTPERYIEIDNKGRTNVPFAYAAGDVTGGFMQIVTATAGGALAANTAFEDLQSAD